MKSYAYLSVLLFTLFSDAHASTWLAKISYVDGLGKTGTVGSLVSTPKGLYSVVVYCPISAPSMYISTGWGDVNLQSQNYLDTEVIVDENTSDYLNWIRFENSVPIRVSELAHELPGHLLRWFIKGNQAKFTMTYAAELDKKISFKDHEISLIGFTSAYDEACGWHPDYNIWRI